MAPLGPFEPRPTVAVALSGGPDSLAAAALVAAWLRPQRGCGLALVVDHGLRSAAAGEAAWAAWAAQRLGLEHRILRWRSKPASPPSQAEARSARYALLDRACAERGCLHLVVAHHADDLARTLAMRRQRGPGPGLAGMPAVRELDHCRILRPFLGVPAARLRATAQRLGWGWIEDPTNRSARYERGRVAPEPLDPRIVRERIADERAAARWFARHARRGATPALRLSGAAFGRLPRAAAARRLAAACASVGGSDHVVSTSRACRLVERLERGARRATLGGALVGWERGEVVLVAEGGSSGGCSALADVPFAAPHVVSDAPFLIC